MTKIIIGTDPYNGTCFGILNKEILVTLFETDYVKYFDNLGNPHNFLLDDEINYNSNEKYIVPHFGGALVHNNTYYALKDDDTIRADLFLITLIENIGIKNIDVAFCGAHLKIIEIPNNVDWYCVRPDLGPMYIQEKSRSWHAE